MVKKEKRKRFFYKPLPVKKKVKAVPLSLRGKLRDDCIAVSLLCKCWT